jgi:predicted cobalt transporter CbtA
MRTLLRNGAIAGGLGGLLASLVMLVYTEPIIRRALAIEDARNAAGMEMAGHHDDVIVTRTEQVIFGAMTMVVVAALFGIIFAVVYARSRHRLPGGSDHLRSLSLAGLGFFTFVLFPALKIPANPPAVGNPATIHERTLVYAASIVAALLLIGLVFGVDQRLRGRVQAAERVSCNVFVAATGLVIALWALPGSPDSIPSRGNAALIPGADLIWEFRIASLAQLGAMWMVIGVAFGLLMTRDNQDAKRHTKAAPSSVTMP